MDSSFGRLRGIHRSRVEGSRVNPARSPLAARAFGTAIVSTFGGAPPAAALPRALPPDEERGREHDREAGDPDVQPHAGDLVRRVDPERLDPEPADAVDEDVEREEVPGPDAPLNRRSTSSSRPAAPKHQSASYRNVGWNVSLLDVVDRPVLGGDLEAPRKVGRLAEELLVPPVAEAADSLRDEERGRDAVRERATR